MTTTSTSRSPAPQTAISPASTTSSSEMAAPVAPSRASRPWAAPRSPPTVSSGAPRTFRPPSNGRPGRFGLAFENSDNVTHLLVRAGRGSSALTSTPTTTASGLDSRAEIIDGVALVETADPPSTAVNSTTRTCPHDRVGPDGNFVPGHVYRCGDDFGIGDFGGAIRRPKRSNLCSAPTDVFCTSADANSVSNTGSTIAIPRQRWLLAANDASWS